MDQYETIARSNEDLRNAMDGTLNEPKSQSTENNKCDCDSKCDHCKCHNNEQSQE